MFNTYVDETDKLLYLFIFFWCVLDCMGRVKLPFTNLHIYAISA